MSRRYGLKTRKNNEWRSPSDPPTARSIRYLQEITEYHLVCFSEIYTERFTGVCCEELPEP